MCPRATVSVPSSPVLKARYYLGSILATIGCPAAANLYDGHVFPHEAFCEVQNDKTPLGLTVCLAGYSRVVCWSGRTAQACFQEEFYRLRKVHKARKHRTF